MKKFIALVVFLLLSALLVGGPIRAIAGFPAPPIEFWSHVVAVCDTQPDQVEVRLQNLTSVDVKITGELWAQPTGGQAAQISSVPLAYQQISPGNWGGPEERIGNIYPNGFTGNVWGWAEIRALTGELIGREELAQTYLACGQGAQVQPKLEFFNHVVAVCDTQPDQVEVRLQNLTSVDVKITGELWAQPTGGQAAQISSVPLAYQQISPGNWGGPEERIGNIYPNGFTGNVWGWAEIRGLSGTLFGKTTLSKVPLSCGGPTPTVVVHPSVTPVPTRTPTPTPTATPPKCPPGGCKVYLPFVSKPPPCPLVPGQFDSEIDDNLNIILATDRAKIPVTGYASFTRTWVHIDGSTDTMDWIHYFNDRFPNGTTQYFWNVQKETWNGAAFVPATYTIDWLVFRYDKGTGDIAQIAYSRNPGKQGDLAFAIDNSRFEYYFKLVNVDNVNCARRVDVQEP